MSADESQFSINQSSFYKKNAKVINMIILIYIKTTFFRKTLLILSQLILFLLYNHFNFLGNAASISYICCLFFIFSIFFNSSCVTQEIFKEYERSEVHKYFPEERIVNLVEFLEHTSIVFNHMKKKLFRINNSHVLFIKAMIFTSLLIIIRIFPFYYFIQLITLLVMIFFIKCFQKLGPYESTNKTHKTD